MKNILSPIAKKKGKLPFNFNLGRKEAIKKV
jgi:hypothetical protein